VVSKPGKTVHLCHTAAIQNGNSNTEKPKTDPNGTITGFEQTDILVFRKYNELGVSSPPAGSSSCNGWSSKWFLSPLRQYT